MAFARPLKELQDDISERIADDDALIGLHLISQDKGDIDTQVNQATAAPAYGIYVVIEAMKMTPKTQTMGAHSMDVQIGLTVTEQVVINRAQANFLPWDYVLMALLTLFSPWGNANQVFELSPEGADVTGDTDGVVSWQLTGRAVVGWVRA